MQNSKENIKQAKSISERGNLPCFECIHEPKEPEEFPCVVCSHHTGCEEMFNYKGEERLSYRDNIVAIMDRQKEKGIKKYGQILEQNDTLSVEQRIEHLQEELIDGLQYCEHLKQATKDNLTANDYQRMAMRTAGDEQEDYLVNAIMGLCGEVGECADIVKKHLFQGHDLNKEKLIDEASDVCWYVALLATALGVTLEEIMLHNVEKLKKRYPDGFDKSRSINREEYTSKMSQNET